MNDSNSMAANLKLLTATLNVLWCIRQQQQLQISNMLCGVNAKALSNLLRLFQVTWKTCHMTFHVYHSMFSSHDDQTVTTQKSLTWQALPDHSQRSAENAWSCPSVFPSIVCAWSLDCPAHVLECLHLQAQNQHMYLFIIFHSTPSQMIRVVTVKTATVYLPEFDHLTIHLFFFWPFSWLKYPLYTRYFATALTFRMMP